MAGDQILNAGLPGLSEPARRVSPRAIGYWTARAALTGLVAVGAAVTIVLVSSAAAAWWAVVAAVAALAVAYTLIMPRWRYAVHRWEVTAEAVFTRSGWFSVTWRVAPISRIQTVDSHRSLGERVFGLANVTATTASAAGPVSINGLDQATASQLLDELAAVTAAVPGDAT